MPGKSLVWSPSLQVRAYPWFMWVKKRSRTRSRSYFFNTETQESVWERPKEGFELFHILVKHAESRKPDKSLARQQALDACKAIYEELKVNFSEAFFMEMARVHSRCSSSERGGYLGFVAGNEMLREFEDCAFALRKGELAGPVETPSGFHIIYRK